MQTHRRRSIRWAVFIAAVISTSPMFSRAQSAMTLSTTAPTKSDETPEPDNSAIIGPDSFRRRVTVLPHGLLWRPPIANPEEPRSYMKLYESLSTDEFSTVNDCAIGGTLPILRVSRIERPDQGVQGDIFAAAFSRFIDIREFGFVDYRFGVPITYAVGNWSFKMSYEHTSCHVGDELLLKEHLKSKDSTRNEQVLGIAYRPIEPLRLYTQIGYAWGISSFEPNVERWRYVVGAEWSKPGPTGVSGQPFAAVDLEFRGDENYEGNFTAQVGWEWSGKMGEPALRFALEYYDGRSPFGQFIDHHESWVAFGAYFDF